MKLSKICITRGYTELMNMLVEPHPEGKSLITGIDCELSWMNEATVIMGLESGAWEKDDIDSFTSFLKFHIAINDKS